MDVAVDQFRDTLTALMCSGAKSMNNGLIDVGVLDWILVSCASSLFQQVRDRVVSIVTLAHLLMEDDLLLDNFIEAWDHEDNWAELEQAVQVESEVLRHEDVGRCPICMMQFLPGDVTAVLPCKHTIHHACIQPWLQVRTTCPICRCDLDNQDNSEINEFTN